MKIEQRAPSASESPSASPAPKPASARERAIAALMKGAPGQSAPVPNPTSISPEEVGAVRAPEAKDAFESAKEKAQKLANEEPSSEAPAETKASEEPLSSQYAILARKEKAIRQREQQLKAREAAIKAQEEVSTKSASNTPTFDESKYISRDKLTNDPFGVLTEMGMTYDQLTEAALNGPKPRELELMNEIKSMREELKALKGETESTKKSFTEYQTQNEKLGIEQLTKSVNTLVNNNPEFETIKETGSIGDVVDLIKQTLKEDGVLLTVEEAAQEVENYLLEEALKLAKIKKIQQRLAPPAPAEAPKAAEAPKQQQLKTLTNAVGSSRPLSARERALLAFEGKLNK